MKKANVILVICLLATLPMVAQVKFGARFTANMSKFINVPDVAELESNAKLGQGGSFLLQIPLAEKWTIRPEVGTGWMRYDYSWVTTQVDYMGNYVGSYPATIEVEEVVLLVDALVGYEVLDGLRVHAGPEFLYSMSLTGSTEGTIMETNEDEKENFLGKIGVSYSFWKYMFVDAYYGVGLTKMSNDSRRAVLEVGIGFML